MHDPMSDDDDFIPTQRTTKRKRVPEEEQVPKAGDVVATTKKATKGVKAVATTTAKLLDVETSKHPLARGPESIGFLNPPLKIYKTKRKSVTERSLAREDEDFVPVQWRYIPRQEEMEVDQVKRERDDRGVVVRAGDIAEEFQIRYLDSSERVGKQNPDKGSDLIQTTILNLLGIDSATTSPVDYADQATPEPMLSQELGNLDNDQREALFQEIFKRGGRVLIIGKPEWNLVIHKAPHTGIIHLCVEKLKLSKGVQIYEAKRICTKSGCYQYQKTLASDVLPKCFHHQPKPIYTVFKVTDYKEREVLVLMHTKLAHSFKENASDSVKTNEASLVMNNRILQDRNWKLYIAKEEEEDDESEGPLHIARSISMVHFVDENDALKNLSLESTIGMFMKLAPGTQPIRNLDDFIPLCYGMEREVDEGLKQLGMKLKIKREYKLAERVEFSCPFIGEYLFGSTATQQQQPEEGKSFLYVVLSQDMWYFGWSDTPDFENRLTGGRSDGASRYFRITRSRPKPPSVKCHLVGKCDDKDKAKIEAILIAAGYVAYLLGLHNPIRDKSPKGYSTNKCLSLSLLDSDSWVDICAFVKLFWGCEPMLGQYERAE